MVEGPVLLDTSAWVCYFRPQGWEELKTAVGTALADGRIVTCWVVKAEILIGSKDTKGFGSLLEHLGSVLEARIDQQVWEAASGLGYNLRRRGLAVPLPDLLIAQVALEEDLVLWHVDQHFEEIRRFCPLRTRSFLPQGDRSA
jgi:predicted nucleic acid-binding protein